MFGVAFGIVACKFNLYPYTYKLTLVCRKSQVLFLTFTLFFFFLFRYYFVSSTTGMEILKTTYPLGEDFYEFSNKHTKYRDGQYLCAVKWVKKFQKDDPLNIADITQDWGIGFKRFLLLNLAHNTASHYLVKVRAILNIAVKDNVIPYNPLEKIKIPLRRPPADQLKKGEIKRLYEKLSEYRGKKRDVLKVFLFGLETGLRVSDVLKLNDSNIRNGYVCLYQQKNDRWVSNLMTDKAKELLKDGLPKVELSKEGIYWHIRRIFKDLGMDYRAKFHIARHTFANTHVELGTPIPVLQELMGHNKIDSTLWYVNPSQDAKDEAMERFGGR